MSESSQIAAASNGEPAATLPHASDDLDDPDDVSLGGQVGSSSAQTQPVLAGSSSAPLHGSADHLTLPQRFHKAEQLFLSLDRLSPDKVQEACASAVGQFSLCDAAVRRMSIFSSNEELDDFATSELKYLFIDYYLAQLFPRCFVKDPRVRLQHLRQATVHANRFMENCAKFKIMSKKQAERWEVEIKSGNDDAEDSGRTAMRRQPPLSREDRIAAFHREKELKTRIAELEHVVAVLRANDGEDDSKYDNEAYEHETRELYMAQLELAVSKLFGDMTMWRREVEMLNFAVKMKNDPDQGHGSAASDSRRRAQGGAAGKDGSQSAGISITHISAKMEITREKLQEGVFKPFRILPTMELDEFARLEVENAIAREKRQKEGQQKRVKNYEELVADGEEDDEALADAAVYKDRSWDNWKDDNPRGCGLTKKY